MNKLPRCNSYHLHHNNDNNNDLYNSVDTFAPTILQPWVWVPSTPSMLYHLQYICHVKRTKINKKRPGLAHLKERWLYRFRIKLVVLSHLFPPRLEQTWKSEKNIIIISPLVRRQRTLKGWFRLLTCGMKLGRLVT